MYDNTVETFRTGMRVELHPALDAWMAGARYGEVTKVGKTLVFVKLDKTGRVRFFSPLSLRPLED